MRVVVGLGNPGIEYRHTRHNLGWMVLEHAARRWKTDFSDKRDSLEASLELGGIQVLLVLPLAWMNQTGPVVRAVLYDRHLGPSDLTVVYDDLDLPFGVLRIKTRGGDGGHNGLRSVLDSVGTEEFCRMKIGIGRPSGGVDIVDYVLSQFSQEEQSQIVALLDRSVDALECLLLKGAAATMNQYHSPMG